MIGTRVSHFEILEKLGEGGMGVVYKAEDTRLKRTVALKFLPDRVSKSATDKARFLQEAQAAAGLNHPNICTIYGVDESEGHLFISMEYIEGGTLREHLPIPKPADAVALAIQIGEGLQEAHARGIVHRDVKAENIMLTAKNQIKIMDFGLAKLKGSLRLTRTSSTIGTLAYMAPEQIQGGEADARSDIFSFGVVFFELLTGHTPFRGTHEAAVMYSILNEEPERVEKSLPEVSPEIARILSKALEKDPEMRYQSVADMVADLRRLKRDSVRIATTGVIARPAPAQPSAPSQAARPITVPPAEAPGLRTKYNRWLVYGGGAGVILIALAGYLLLGPRTGSGPEPGRRKLLVVLPFENLGSADKEYFADGITEEITGKLSGLSGLGVIARSSAMQYKKTTKTLRQVGEELGVSFALQGTIRWETSEGTTRVRVTPQLINIADGTQMWSRPSEAVFASAFKLQSDIAGQVATALDVTLLQPEKHSLETVPTNNAEAYDSYFRGIQYLYRSTAEEDYRIAERMFQRAVDLDPTFARAYAKLGFLHSNMYWEYYDHSEGRVQKSKQAAERALELDPDLPDAHGAMGWYYYHCLRDFEKGREEFQRGLKAEPNNTDLLLGIASVSRRQGQFAEAVTYFERIVGIDPRSPSMMQDLANTYIMAMRYAEAEKTYDRCINLAPDVAEGYYNKAFLYVLWRGDVSAARHILDDAAGRNVGRGDATFLYNTISIDLLEGKFSQAASRLQSAEHQVFSYQQWYVPREMLLAQIHGYMKQPAKQKALFNAALMTLEGELRSHPDDPRMHSSLGICLAGLGRTDEAIREGKHGVELVPLPVEALNTPYRMQDLALIYTMTGKDDAAIDMLEQLVRIFSPVTVPLLRLDPAWNPLRSNPRFQKLVAEQK